MDAGTEKLCACSSQWDDTSVRAVFPVHVLLES